MSGDDEAAEVMCLLRERPDMQAGFSAYGLLEAGLFDEHSPQLRRWWVQKGLRRLLERGAIRALSSDRFAVVPAEAVAFRAVSDCWEPDGMSPEVDAAFVVVLRHLRMRMADAGPRAGAGEGRDG